MRRRQWAAWAFVGFLAGCGSKSENYVARFSPKAELLARQMAKCIEVHNTGESGGLVMEAERLSKSGGIEWTDFETFRRIDAALRANSRNQATRIFETARGLRAHAGETAEEKAAEEKKKADEAAKNESAPKPNAENRGGYGKNYPAPVPPSAPK